MKTLVVATHNENKLKDLLFYLKDLPFDLCPIKNFTLEEPNETGETFEDNALLKACHSFQFTGFPSISDDSGFCMRNLDGMPGIYASRFATQDDGSKNFKMAFEKLQSMLGDQDPATDFVCTLAYKDGGEEKIFKGIVPGFFDFTKSHDDGFGYTPIFVPYENNPKQLSLAEMGDDLRRQFSARKRAADLFIKWLTDRR